MERAFSAGTTRAPCKAGSTQTIGRSRTSVGTGPSSSGALAGTDRRGKHPVRRGRLRRGASAESSGRIRPAPPEKTGMTGERPGSTGLGPEAEDAGPVEISIVMACLNEADTIAVCLEKAFTTLRSNGIAGEVVVADNGSTDGSAEIAEKMGARVIRVLEKGYGCALMGGIAAARGSYVVMGDADDSYDFREIPRFLAKLREGYELVQGCRLEGGGG